MFKPVNNNLNGENEMTDTISLTIPLTDDALTRAADFFHGLAIDLREGGAPTAFAAKAGKVKDAPIATSLSVVPGARS